MPSNEKRLNFIKETLNGYRQVDGVKALRGDFLISRSQLLNALEGPVRRCASPESLLRQILTPKIRAAMRVRNIKQSNALQRNAIQVKLHSIARQFHKFVKVLASG